MEEGGGELKSRRWVCVWTSASAFLTQDLEVHRYSCPLDCEVYVGNLGNNGNKTELEQAFGYYGPLRSVGVARNPPGFVFVEFEDPRDAAESYRGWEDTMWLPSKSGTVRWRKEKSKSRPPSLLGEGEASKAEKLLP